MKTLLILGAGGHGKVVAEAAAACGRWGKIVLFDERYPEIKQAAGFPVIGGREELRQSCALDSAILIAVGDNRRRLELVRAFLCAGREVPPLVHPTASVSPSARLGRGAVVLAQAVVNAEASIGAGVIVNSGAIIEHDCALADGVHVSPGAKLGGNVQLGEMAWVGIGASILHGIRVGARAVVGAGAVVVRDVDEGSTVVGVPAKPLRESHS